MPLCRVVGNTTNPAFWCIVFEIFTIIISCYIFTRVIGNTFRRVSPNPSPSCLFLSPRRLQNRLLELYVAKYTTYMILYVSFGSRLLIGQVYLLRGLCSGRSCEYGECNVDTVKVSNGRNIVVPIIIRGRDDII